MQSRTNRPVRLLVSVAAIVSVVSALTAMAAGPGTDAGLWHYRTGFIIVRWSVYIAAGAGVVALIGSALAAAARHYRVALLGLVATAIALAVVAPRWELQRTASRVPRIHDITTDTDDPPQFVALLAVRKKTPNGPEYAGEKIAREQKAAYPDIQPLMLSEPPAAVFERALAAARSMGWEIVAAVPAAGRIEATATTRWFRFKDDIIVRVTAQPAGSRIDVRSKSRIGRSDLGTNAKRIRAYLSRLRNTR
ncbi:MAG: hypothetical protein V7640_1695 [Betaproteobacteria bacterium]|jgi:uncharacterized protein (DUF1499 family)